VGDIACPPGDPPTETRCQHAATAGVVESLEPEAVLVLGDAQYDRAELADFRESYDDSWGELLSITRPVPGNHEYMTNGASGYYTYFAGQQPGPPGYYAFNIGDWRLYALNDQCAHIDCADEVDWLRSDLAANRRACTLMYMHEPLVSSGAVHGNNISARPFWQAAYAENVDIALAGHDHHYERFALLDPDRAAASDGIQSFVVGTGGKSLYELGAAKSGSVVRDDEHHGVLALRLGDEAYKWKFVTTVGTVTDSGAEDCR
jgi:hypothetical protein